MKMNEAIPWQSAHHGLAARGFVCLQVFQIFLYIQVLDFTNLLALAPIQDIFSRDGSIAVFRVSAFLPIYQMTVLLRHDLVAVLDLENLAGGCLGIEYHHVKLTNGKLQDKNLFIMGCELTEAPCTCDFLALLFEYSAQEVKVKL